MLTIVANVNVLDMVMDPTGMLLCIGSRKYLCFQLVKVVTFGALVYLIEDMYMLILWSPFCRPIAMSFTFATDSAVVMLIHFGGWRLCFVDM